MNGAPIVQDVPFGNNLYPGTPVYIGVDSPVFNGPFRGEVDEVRIFHRALSPCEIRALSQL